MSGVQIPLARVKSFCRELRKLFYFKFIFLELERDLKRSERADRRKAAMDGSYSERRRRGRSKQDVCDCNAKSLLPLNKKKALTLRKCLLPFNQL